MKTLKEMNKAELISEVSKFFKLQELVCAHTYNKFGSNAWRFIDERQLATIVAIRRDILKVGLVCNDYPFGGGNTQRGLRCNMCPIVKTKTNTSQCYQSAHLHGKANDFVSSKMTAQQMRDLIVENADLLPYPVRLEDGVTWLHIDTENDTDKKVVLFKA